MLGFFFLNQCAHFFALAEENNVTTPDQIPTSRAEFCNIVKQKKSLYLYYNNNNVIALNSDGAFHVGFCWWASLLTQRAIQLSYVNPAAPKPAAREIPTILAKLKKAQEVLEIPGYQSLSEFYEQNADQIKSFLAAWQFEDITQVYHKNLKYDLHPTAQQLWAEAMKAHALIQQKKEAYIILKYPFYQSKILQPFIAHSLILFNSYLMSSPVMNLYGISTAESVNSSKDQQCLLFEARDSNNVNGFSILAICEHQTQAQYYYTNQQYPITQINMSRKFIDSVVFYVQREKELELVRRTSAKFCN